MPVFVWVPDTAPSRGRLSQPPRLRGRWGPEGKPRQLNGPQRNPKAQLGSKVVLVTTAFCKTKRKGESLGGRQSHSRASQILWVLRGLHPRHLATLSGLMRSPQMLTCFRKSALHVPTRAAGLHPPHHPPSSILPAWPLGVARGFPLPL